MNDSLLALTLAFEFAAQKHIDQRRKGLRAEPYLNHLAEVAGLLARASGGRDPVLVIAGLLHDTVEDTATTAAELEQEFGAEVAALVLEVTDDKTLAKSERKHRQVTTAPHKSARARLIKIADKTSNLRAVALSPPEGWSVARRLDYFNWARQVVAGCRGLNPDLEAWFDQAFREGMARLGEEGGGAGGEPG
ncbi:MAG: HD domain-containing protein [Azospirillum sp.]|nr:HD domain-containing protein [Azospirillum sp.]